MVLSLILLFLIEGEGLLTLVRGLFILLLLPVNLRKVNQLGEGFVAVEEVEVVAAGCGVTYMREARKDWSSLRPMTCWRVRCLWVCYLGGTKSLPRCLGWGRSLLSLRRKWRTSAGVLAVSSSCMSAVSSSSSAWEGVVRPFLRFFLRSFSILTNLRKNFCAWERTCEVVLDSTLL
jgi:hypothetical protein